MDSAGASESGAPDRTLRSLLARRRSVAALVALALLATACGSSATMATVDGQPIERDEVIAMRTAYEGSATANGDEIRDDLGTLIIQAAVVEAAREEFGIEIGDADIADRIANPPARYRPLFDALAADGAVGQGTVAVNAVFSLVRDAVVGELMLEQYGSGEALLGQAPQYVILVCARHILVGTEEEALDVIDRIDAGEDFDALVAEVSLGERPDGLLAPPEGGCPLHLGALGDDFALAAVITPVGEVVGPLQTDADADGEADAGFHVLIVDERIAPTPEALEADVAAYLDPQLVSGLFTPWFNEAVRVADIEVASNIGSWSTAGVGISPPGGDRSAPTVTPPVESDDR